MMTRAAYPNSGDRTIQREFFQYHVDYAPEWSDIAPAWSPEKGKDYTIAELAGLGQLRYKAEGAGMSLDRLYGGHKQTITFSAYALAAQATKEMMEDDLHGNISKALSRLARSANKTEEILFMAFMANTFGTSVGWDANAVCYDTHTTLRGGTTLDNLTTAALSPTSFQAGLDYFAGVVGADDIPVMRVPRKLLHARKNSPMVFDLLKSENRVLEYASRDKAYVNDGSNNLATVAGTSLNRFNPANGFVSSWTASENHYYSIAGADDDDWWLFAEDPDRAGIQMLRRNAVELEDWYDNWTKSRIFSAWMRLAFACPDYTTIYGGNVA